MAVAEATAQTTAGRGAGRVFGAFLGLVTLALAVGVYTQLGSLGLGLAPAVVLLLATVPLFVFAGVLIRGVSHARQRGHTAYPMTLSYPSLSYYAAFFLIPLAYLLLFAVATPVGFGEVAYGFDLGNFSAALDSLYIDVFLRTLRAAAIGTLLIMLVGYPLAYWIARYAPENRRGLFLMLVILPFWTSFLIRTYSFLIVLSPEFFLSDWLQSLHLTDSPLHVLNTMTAIQIGLVYNYLPLFVLPLYATLERMDWRLVDAATDLGATQWTAFRQITLRLTAPGPDHRDAARVHPDDGRVRDPADPRRRPRRLHRQRHPAGVPRAAGLRVRLRARRPRDGRAVVLRDPLPVPVDPHGVGVRCVRPARSSRRWRSSPA